MNYVPPATHNEDEPPAGRYRFALAEAVAGLEAIRDEGPDIDPTYPGNGILEAHENWAFDSASCERAQSAKDTLERVAAIMDGRLSPSS